MRHRIISIDRIITMLPHTQSRIMVVKVGVKVVGAQTNH
jgi:hypothetical protein